MKPGETSWTGGGLGAGVIFPTRPSKGVGFMVGSSIGLEVAGFSVVGSSPINGVGFKDNEGDTEGVIDGNGEGGSVLVGVGTKDSEGEIEGNRVGTSVVGIPVGLLF